MLIALAVVLVAALVLRGYAAFARSGGVTPGLANSMTITRTMSADAVRRGAFRTRPSTVTTHSTPPRETGMEICRIRRWRGGWRYLYAGFRDIVLVVAPPGSGKTALLGCHVQDAPGAVLVASTRSDLYQLTIASRSRRPVHVFNPYDIGGVTNTLRWSPVWGCSDEQYAIRVAGLLVGAGANGGQSDAEFWQEQSVRALRCLLAAADLADADMATVVQWASTLTSTRPISILEQHGRGGWAGDLRAIKDMPEKTRGSVSTTLSTSLQFMADSVLAVIASPSRDEQFDPREVLRTGATVYVIGKSKDHDPVSPLFAALTGVLFDVAGDIAERSPGQRLDPPLMMVLDEVTNIFRVPLDQWTSFSGGLGIPMVIAAQGHHQLRKAFGDEGAKAVWSNAAVKLAFGGDLDPETLNSLVALCGDRPAALGSENRRPVLFSKQIQQLPDMHVLVLRRNNPAVIGAIRPVWDRKDPPVAEPLVAETSGPLAEVVVLADRQRKAS